jgi:hypothetical protein
METEAITNRKLNDLLRKHKLWLEDETKGKRADFGHYDLGSVDLRNKDLRGAYLFNTDYTKADIRGADFRGTLLTRPSFRVSDNNSGVKIDKRTARDLIAFICSMECDDKEFNHIRDLGLKFMAKVDRETPSGGALWSKLWGDDPFEKECIKR